MPRRISRSSGVPAELRSASLHHARALSALTHKDTPFDISPSTPAYQSFCSLRDAFLSAPLLRSFDPSSPIQLITDASDFALAANLHQPDTAGIFHPVAFFSRQLAPEEKNYTAYDKEMLAIVEGLKQFRHWCHGCASQLSILTDHRNLVYFQQAQRLNDRQARWQEQLAEFDFVIEHLAGNKNPADPPSRRPDYGAAVSHDHRLQFLLPPERLLSSSSPSLGSQAVISFQVPTSELLTKLRDAWDNDQEFASAEAEDNPDFRRDDGYLLYRHRLFVPQALRHDLISQHHDSPAAGHRGHSVTYDLLTRTFDWPGSRRAVRDYVRRCDSCARNKIPRHLPYGELQPLEVPSRPWQLIGMDHAVDLPVSQGFDSIWIVVCLFSGEAHFVPCHKSDDANTLAQQFLANIFRLHGLPDRIISDRGATFISQFWRRLLHLLDVKASPSTAYHPQTNGKSERTIQTLEAYLRCYISYHQDDWAAWLPLAEFAFNNARSASSEQSPFFITRGFHPTFTPGIATSSVVPAAEQLSEHLERTWNEVRAQLRWAKDQMAKYYNQRRSPAPTYKIGDQVWLLRRNIPTTRPSDKLDHRRLGPFTIAAQVGNSAYRLTLPSQLSSLHPVFPVVLLEPYVGSNNPGSAPSTSHLAPTLDQAWQSVEQVLDQRKIRNRYHYLLRWRDKPTSEDTWRPLDDIPVSLEPLPQAFHRRYPRYTVPADLRPPPLIVRRLRDRVLVQPRETPSPRSVPLAPSTAAAPPQSRVSSSSHSLQPRPSATRDPGVSSRPSPAPPPTPANQLAPATSRATLQTTPLAPPSHGPPSAPFASAPPSHGRVLRSSARRP